MKKIITLVLATITILSMTLFASCGLKEKVKDLIGKSESTLDEIVNSSEVEKESESTSIPDYNVPQEEVPQRLIFEHNGEGFSFVKEMEMNAGQTYTIDLKLINDSGKVNEIFGNYEIVECRMYGAFLVKQLIKAHLTDTFVQAGEEKITSDFFTDLNIALDIFYEAKIENEKLIINAIASEKTFLYDYAGPLNTVRFTYLSEYYDPRGGGNPSDVYFAVYVRDTVSGVYSLLTFDIE